MSAKAAKNTTVTIRESTRRRLVGYKRGGSSFDDLLNRLMDKVDVEDLVAEDIAEHYRILNDPGTEWVDGDEVKALLDEKIAAAERRGPARSKSSGPGKR